MSYPGSAIHQKMLVALTPAVLSDKNVRLLGVFGSLPRGDWDAYSDLDLDAVVHNPSPALIGQHIDAMRAALTAAGFPLLLQAEEQSQSFVLITDGLERISIRFHTLSDTNPVILDSLLALGGTLPIDQLRQAVSPLPTPDDAYRRWHTKFLELAIYVPINLHRRRYLTALSTVDLLRSLLIRIYCQAHGIPKADKFDRLADPGLVLQLHGTYALPQEQAIRHAYTALARLYEEQIETLSQGHVSLTDNDRTLLRKALRLQ